MKRNWLDGALLGSAALALLGGTWNVAEAEPSAALIDAASKRASSRSSPCRMTGAAMAM